MVRKASVWSEKKKELGPAPAKPHIEEAYGLR